MTIGEAGKKFVEKMLDFLFPKPPETQAIEQMSPEKFLLRAPPAEFFEEEVTALFEYRNSLVRSAVWEIKYWKNESIARMIAKIIHDHLLEEISLARIFKNFEQPLLVPIPASKRRLRERGYNQCEFLVKQIADIDGGKNFEVADILRKTRETSPQTEIKQKNKRRENVKGCFTLTQKARVNGRNIIIIDDVITTGSTIQEARRALREAGARKIIAFAIAH